MILDHSASPRQQMRTTFLEKTLILNQTTSGFFEIGSRLIQR
jgi:hypothetical protein